jgi:hypothetical protein
MLSLSRAALRQHCLQLQSREENSVGHIEKESQYVLCQWHQKSKLLYIWAGGRDAHLLPRKAAVRWNPIGVRMNLIQMPLRVNEIRILDDQDIDTECE